MGLLNVLKFVTDHPLNRGRKGKALLNFFSWQIGSRLVPGPVAIRFVNDARLLVSRGMTGATGNLYAGLHEFEDMSFTLHLLREGDLFVDIGANIGSYSILAGAVAGAGCIAIEPVPSTFRSLMDNVNLNDSQERIECLNIGVGGGRGVLRFTSGQDTTNHVVSNGEDEGESIEVPVDSLDNILGDRQPTLLKIDVEGFETEVIAGAEGALSHETLLAVIMELNGSGARYGFDEDALRSTMTKLGFRQCRYDVFKREIQPLAPRSKALQNTIFMRDIEKASVRVKSAPRFNVRGRFI